VKRKRYSRKFQRAAVARMETCEDVGELARELGVRPRCLYKWRRKLEMVEPGQEASRPSTHASAHRKEIYRLKQLLAEKTLEKIYERTSKSSSRSITIGSGCTRRWGIDLPKSSNSKSRRQLRPNLEAQRWCSLRTNRTTRGVLQGYWGRRLKCRPLPQTPSLARRCKNAFTKAEAGSKKTVPL
jgi:transposase-like protein